MKKIVIKNIGVEQTRHFCIIYTENIDHLLIDNFRKCIVLLYSHQKRFNTIKNSSKKAYHTRQNKYYTCAFSI